MRIVGVVVVLTVVSVVALFVQQSRRSEYFVSGVLEADDIRVGSRVGGRVAAVKVQEGQRVAAGEVLVELEAFDLRERLAQSRGLLDVQRAILARREAGFRSEEREQARARRDRLQSVLDELVAGKRPLEIQILEHRLDQSQAELQLAQIEYDRVKALAADVRTRDEFDRAASAREAALAKVAAARDELALGREGSRAEHIAQARANLAEAEQALAMAVAGYRTDEIAEARGSVAAAEASVAAVERQLDEIAIKAPVASIVDAIDLQPGDLLAPNAPAVSLIAADRLWIRAYVPENRLDLLIGQELSVRVDALPERRFRAALTHVARQGEFTPSNAQTPEERSKQVFRVRAQLLDGLDVLRAGMAADVFLKPGAAAANP
ncbi:MAG: hypothetical protein CHACPFDD_03944 [Phycisphaerae bacterium]|nr:hypothetical protein [Phycisphaerae bacterium]